MARDAVIVSTARTPVGRAYKGAFNATPGPTLGALSLKPAIERAGIDPGEIDDVVWGTVLTQGTQFGNIGRQVQLRAGCPVSVSGMPIDRQLSSRLMAIATAAKPRARAGYLDHCRQCQPAVRRQLGIDPDGG